MMTFWEKITFNLKDVLGNSLEIHQVNPLSGGDINDVYKLTTSVGDFCIKVNNDKLFPEMFEKEALGLISLKQHSKFTVPEPIYIGKLENKSFLLMNYIDSVSKGKEYWESFGMELAEMHRNSAAEFGLNYDNYIGSLSQQNTYKSDWVDFYYTNRLQQQLTLGSQKGIFNKTDEVNATILYKELGSIIPEEQPSLLHGDLWSGNIMSDNNGKPTLIDPAIYYGHREMDLAMTRLFGGFDHSMYEAYHSTYPLEKNWEERIEIHNLYPLLVHANLFGGGYIHQVKAILKKFK